MYYKDLKESIHLRLSEDDFRFLVALSLERGCSVSEVIRQLISFYRFTFVDEE